MHVGYGGLEAVRLPQVPATFPCSTISTLSPPHTHTHAGYDEGAYGVQPQGPKAETKDATSGYQAGGGYQAPHLRG